MSLRFAGVLVVFGLAIWAGVSFYVVEQALPWHDPRGWGAASFGVLLALAGAVGLGWRWSRGPASRRAHASSQLLFRVLPERLRKTIRDAYDDGDLLEAYREVESARARQPGHLGLHYWAIHLQIDCGRTEAAKQALIELLPQLPEAALTLRWSHLFERVGEQELWIANVLERIRTGAVVRRSTYRELIRLLADAGRIREALYVLSTLRETDPPTPEESSELDRTEIVLAMQRVRQMLEAGEYSAAFERLAALRPRAISWPSLYQFAARALLGMDKPDTAHDWWLEGFRNTGNPDLLLRAYRQRIETVDPVRLLEQWDQALEDLVEDDGYLLVSGWVALRHGLFEEGAARLQQIAEDAPAHAHAMLLYAGFEYDRGHAEASATQFRQATAAWLATPLLWQCGGCGTLSERARSACNDCGSWDSYHLVRPITPELAPVRPE